MSYRVKDCIYQGLSTVCDRLSLLFTGHYGAYIPVLDPILSWMYFRGWMED